MQTTTRTLNNYRNPKMCNLSLEQLSSLYRQKKQDAIIAEAFDRIKRLIVVNRRQYTQVQICDCISFALQDLELCLLTYVPGSSNKFTTYFCKVYKNTLLRHTLHLNYDKRKLNNECASLNYLMEQGFDYSNNMDMVCNILCLPESLTQKEKQYCYLVAIDYGTNKEIAEYMNVSTMTLCNIRKSLRFKLQYLYK